MIHNPIPNPARAAAPYAVIATCVALAAARHDVPALTGRSLLSAAVIAGLFAGLVSWGRRITICNQTDDWIAYGAGEPPTADVEFARRRELVTMRHRRGLARSFRRFRDAERATRTASAQVPADVEVAAACRGELDLLAEILADEGRTVSARGVARAERLVREPTSPLFRTHPPRVVEAHHRLCALLDDLERTND